MDPKSNNSGNSSLDFSYPSVPQKNSDASANAGVANFSAPKPDDSSTKPLNSVAPIDSPPPQNDSTATSQQSTPVVNTAIPTTDPNSQNSTSALSDPKAKPANLDSLVSDASKVPPTIPASDQNGMAEGTGGKKKDKSAESPLKSLAKRISKLKEEFVTEENAQKEAADPAAQEMPSTHQENPAPSDNIPPAVPVAPAEEAPLESGPQVESELPNINDSFATIDQATSDIPVVSTNEMPLDAPLPGDEKSFSPKEEVGGPDTIENDQNVMPNPVPVSPTDNMDTSMDSGVGSSNEAGATDSMVSEMDKDSVSEQIVQPKDALESGSMPASEVVDTNSSESAVSPLPTSPDLSGVPLTTVQPNDATENTPADTEPLQTDMPPMETPAGENISAGTDDANVSETSTSSIVQVLPENGAAPDADMSGSTEAGMGSTSTSAAQSTSLDSSDNSTSSNKPYTFNIDQLLDMVIEREASDLHITVGYPAMIRTDGALQNAADEIVTPEQATDLILRVLPEQKKELLEVNREVDLAYAHKSDARFRINAYYQQQSLAAAFRLIPNRIRSVDELGLPPVYHQLAKLRQGLVLVTGPTGSGKSTTLAAIIQEVNETRPDHIITIEDPIEYVFPEAKAMVDQRELHDDTHSWEIALKSAMRQDPDVILVGEMRDYETIAAAITLAETGHLVFATLHTNNAAQTIDRVIDVFPEHQQSQVRSQLSNVIEAVIAQRLIPLDKGGRMAISEIMIATPAIRNLIREAKTHQLDNVIRTSADIGMISLEHSLVKLVRDNLVTMDKAQEYAVHPEEVVRLLKS